MIPHTPHYEFHSVFAPFIQGYLEQLRIVGKKTTLPGNSLRQFDRYCSDIGWNTVELTEILVNNYLNTKSDEKAQTHCTRISVLKCFSEYLCGTGVDVSWIPTPGYAHTPNRYIPYIFTKAEIVDIMKAADRMVPSTRGSRFHIVFPTILRVLYASGLRISEALALKVGDVDLAQGFIVIRNAKFGKDRKLPVSRSLLERLRTYRMVNAAHIGIDADSWFFPNTKGECYSQRTFYDKFRQILWQAGISHQGKGKGPRVHDLRHTFAVHSLQQNIEMGKDIYTSLTGLMVYLGHSKISSTEYYLRLTAEVFPDFLERADSICAKAIPEVTHYEE